MHHRAAEARLPQERRQLVHQTVKAAVSAASHSTLDEALEGEVRGQLRLLASADFQEGIAAFLEKRPPAFKGE